MQLTLWTYEGPPHVGAIRVAASMKGVHLVLHAPQGDTYADLLFTMIERDKQRPPVTYTTFQARDLGGSTAEKFLDSLVAAEARFKPDVLLVADSCTAELLQDQPGSLAEGTALSVPLVPLEMAAYSRKENWGASETLFQLVASQLRGAPRPTAEETPREQRPSVNILGPTKLGFRCRDDVREVVQLLERVGIDVNVVAPLGATYTDLKRLPEAQANVCLYPEVAQSTCDWLQREFRMPVITAVPMGVNGTLAFLEELAKTLSIDIDMEDLGDSRSPWYSRSIDSNYLTGKRVFVFGDATHAVSAAKVATDEFAFEVVGIGTYAREQAREVRAHAKSLGLDALITNDYLDVERAIEAVQPELILGTQMERHIAKRLGIGCAVISTPAHVQDYPARYSPQFGFEGANVLFDTWVHPLMMGLEEHLLTMFREDFEFNDNAAPSHLGEGGRNENTPTPQDDGLIWANCAEQELKKIPFFVRGKARRNTEQFALERGVHTIDVETLYEAKAHFSR